MDHEDKQRQRRPQVGDGAHRDRGAPSGGSRIADLMQTPEGRQRLLRRRQQARKGTQAELAATNEREQEPTAEHSRVEVIEPEIESVPSTEAERQAMLAQMVQQERADAQAQVRDEHIAGMVKTNIMARLSDARIAFDHGVQAFTSVTEKNPALKRASTESLGSFGWSVVGWLRATALGNIDRLMGMKPQAIPVMAGPPGATGGHPAAPERDHVSILRGGLDGATKAATSGALEMKDGALALGTAGSAVAAAALIGSYLDNVHDSWIQERSLTTLADVLKRLRAQVSDASTALTQQVRLATPEQTHQIAERTDVTRPFFVAAEVSDRLHVLFLDAMRNVLGAGDYIDAMHGVKERQVASRDLGGEKFGAGFANWKDQ